MVSREGVFSAALKDDCVHLAERLKYDLVGLSIDTRLDGRSFEALASESAKRVRVEARKRGVRFEHIIRAGDLGSWIEEIIREIKRVELAVVDIEADSEEIRGITVPVISVISSSNRKGGRVMAVQAGSSKVKAAVQMAGCGALSAVAYAAVFTNTDTVMQLFTRGGWYASLPIATVLAISFVYGAFASSLWSLLGIEAHKRDHVRQTERKIIEKRNQLRKRPRLYAYINPFHRIDM
ncbi:MAG: LapA family protein [Syntrophobacteraceae bacterium]